MSYLASPWLPAGVLVALSLIARRLQGSWLAPSVFPALVLSGYISIPLMALSDRISAVTVWVLVAVVFSAQVGAICAEGLAPSRSVGKRVDDTLRKALVSRCLAVVLGTSLVALVGGLVYALSSLRQLDLSLSWEGFLGLGGVLYGVIVAGEGDPWWFRLTRMWIFPAAFLSGILFALGTSRLKKTLSLVWFVPVLLIGTTLASRYGTTMAIGCWVAAYLATKVYDSGGRFRLGMRALLTALSIFVVCVAIYVALGIVRGHKYGDVSDDSAQLRSNLFGYLAVFDSFVNNESAFNRTFGRYSLAGAFDLLGLSKREAALDYEPIMLQNGTSSNVYTAFRGLIQDFSLPGTLLLSLGCGLVCGIAYMRASTGNIGSVLILAGYYSFFLWSPIASVFNYNSVWLGLWVAWFVVTRDQRNISMSNQQAARLALRTKEA
jgi:oligosaccharide repeat unit polymerase